MEIGLSLGSNLGDRLALLKEAKRKILAVRGVTLAAQSSVYETEPVNVPPTDMNLLFLNAVLVVETHLEIVKLWPEMVMIQHQLGRPADARQNERRTIDIDIVYADALCVNVAGVKIPHPRWASRRFVVLPLNDVRPDLVIPGQTLAVRDILARLADRNRVALYARNW